MSLVSIVMPTHNRVELLKRALKSALAQTHSEVEVIVVNDGSSDGTADYLKTITDERVKHLSLLTPHGACFARNEGIRSAEGKYITFLDDDDEYLPERVELLIDAYRPRFAYAASAHFYIHQNGRKEIINFGRNITIEDMLLRIETGNTILTETHKVRELGGFDESLTSSQDYDLWLRLNLRYGEAAYVQQPLFIMHTEHEKPRITTSKKKFKGHWHFYQKHKNHFNSRQRAYQLFELIRCQNKKVSLRKTLKLTYRSNLIRGIRHYLAVNHKYARKIYFMITRKQ